MYKLLIVEDERWEREGLVEFLDWTSLNIEIVGTACDGIEGLDKMVEWNPDIVITDIRMPGMDGLEMAKRMKEYKANVKIIILSGYGDFEYARQAIHLNASHYVLKPISEDTLMEALVKVLKECESENFARKEDQLVRIEIESQRQLIRQKWAVDLLAGNLDLRYLKELAEWAGFPEDTLSFAVMAMTSTVNWSSGSIQQAVRGPHLAVYSERCGGHWLVVQPMVEYDEPLKLARTLKDRLMALGGFLKESEITIAIGEKTNNLTAISVSAQSALEGLEYAIFWGETGLLDEERIEQEKKRFLNEATDFLQKGSSLIKQIIYAVHAQDEKNALVQVESLLDLLNERRGADGDYIRNYLNGLLFELSVLAGTHGSKENTGILPNKELYMRVTFIDISHYIKSYMQSTLSYLREKSSGKDIYIINKVNQLIEQQYNSTEISLKSVAEEMFLSPNYLGSLYKKATGESIGNRLNQIRMDKAKELLQLSHYKVNRVAAEVGIPNTSYFCTLFKEAFGISPGEYQETIHRK